jgi:hypothetical protein
MWNPIPSNIIHISLLKFQPMTATPPGIVHSFNRDAIGKMVRTCYFHWFDWIVFSGCSFLLHYTNHITSFFPNHLQWPTSPMCFIFLSSRPTKSIRLTSLWSVRTKIYNPQNQPSRSYLSTSSVNQQPGNTTSHIRKWCVLFRWSPFSNHGQRAQPPNTEQKGVVKPSITLMETNEVFDTRNKVVHHLLTHFFV